MPTGLTNAELLLLHLGEEHARSFCSTAVKEAEFASCWLSVTGPSQTTEAGLRISGIQKLVLLKMECTSTSTILITKVTNCVKSLLLI